MSTCLGFLLKWYSARVSSDMDALMRVKVHGRVTVIDKEGDASDDARLQGRSFEQRVATYSSARIPLEQI